MPQTNTQQSTTKLPEGFAIRPLDIGVRGERECIEYQVFFHGQFISGHKTESYAKEKVNEYAAFVALSTRKAAA